MSSQKERALSVFLALFLAGCLAWWLYLRPILLRGKQVMNCTNLRTYGAALEAYRRAHGIYPDRLLDAMKDDVDDVKFLGFPMGVDAWNHELVYKTDGDSFIVVSLGRDGKPDGLDFWSLRAQPVQDWPAENKRCVSFDADAMVTDRGGSRPCCK